jgi:hypothetical protein
MLRPVQYTVAPASPSMQAMPRPAPRVAPVTTATLPANVPSVSDSIIASILPLLLRSGQLHSTGIAVCFSRPQALHFLARSKQFTQSALSRDPPILQDEDLARPFEHSPAM